MIAIEQQAIRRAGRLAGLAACALALIATPAAVSAQQEEPVYGDEYGSGNFGRVRDAENGVSLVRTDWERAEGLEYEGVNSPIFPGDRLSTGPEQRVEVELADGTLIRVDRRTELTFLSLPDPYAEFADNTVLQLVAGRIRVQTSLRDDEEVRIDTPASTVYPLGDADLRIEVSARDRTRVLSRRGVAEVVGAGGSVLVRGGMHTEVEPGALPHDPQAFNTFASDGFDLWVEEREAVYARQYATGGTEAYRNIPTEVQPYYRELSANGSWFYTNDFGWVWSPSGVAADWRPYHDGYWGYGPQGYFWVSNEPWGWAPYHYGRWAWVGGYGWSWVPGRVFAGAWVSWSWGSVYVGWSPLDCWGYPAYRSAAYYGYYDPYAWTFVSYHHVHHYDYYHHSVSVGHVGDHVHRNAVVTRPPRVSPRKLAGSKLERQRAFKLAREDVRGKIPPASRADRRSAPRFRKIEERLARKGHRDPDRRPPGRGSAGQGPERVGRRQAVSESRYPRQLSTGATERARKPPVTRRPTGERGKTPLPQVKRRESDSRGGVDRVRDMYRKMAQPRQTRERADERAAPPRGSTRKQAPKARPKPGSGSRKPAPKARPQSGSGSRGPAPKARPKSGSGSRRPAPKARPRSSSGSKPKAGPSPRSRGKPGGGGRRGSKR